MRATRPIESSVTRRNGRFRVVFSPLGLDKWVDLEGLKSMTLFISRSDAAHDDKMQVLRQINQVVREWAEENEPRQSSASLWLVDGFFLIMTFAAGFALGGVVL
jgi:hypothetical protein